LDGTKAVQVGAYETSVVEPSGVPTSIDRGQINRWWKEEAASSIWGQWWLWVTIATIFLLVISFVLLRRRGSSTGENSR